ncbi:glutathione S-transferase family protein [Legionella sp. km772]|uniref:glutathione S-transferase family protein n=1 Tax=Legionella sp. km772 TaxID=2498111 RepID=UPI000F8DECF1|nr:glutathione S-transferase family protein [Legionella sp. km772]RUR05323.1 glutathione S-transferase family protein [Legionella sp. km772]
MGKLVEGKWVDQWYETKSHGGAFQRENSVFNDWIGKNSAFTTESGRYHLYVSLACPWAHRTLIFRKLKNLEQHISYSIVSHDMLEKGWTFDKAGGSSGDALYGLAYLYELYTKAVPHYTGRVTVPVLWDKKTQQIVNNESSQIIRIFNEAFNSITGNTANYYPHEQHHEIDRLNDFIYENINNGVYRCGFATTQAAYEEAYKNLFSALDKIETILGSKRYLAGDNLTEADWRLFTTLIRFDEVYYGHFKCNKQRIEDYPNLSAYRRELYQWPGIKETTDFYHIKRHYYFSHTTINPTQIVPLGPKIDYERPWKERL